MFVTGTEVLYKPRANKPALWDLVKYTKDVRDRYQLGVELGLPTEELDQMQEHYSLHHPMNPVVHIPAKWLLQDKQATWKKYVQALMKLNETSLANFVAKNHAVGRVLSHTYE